MPKPTEETRKLKQAAQSPAAPEALEERKKRSLERKGEKRQGGRPYSLKPGQRQQILSAVEAGNYKEQAAKMVGMSSGVLSSWLDKGAPVAEYDENGNLLREDYPDDWYGKFAKDFDVALAKAEARAVGAMTSHFDTDWRAAAEFLKMRFPDRWNPKVAVEHTGKDGGPIELSQKREELFAALDVIDLDEDQIDQKELGDGSE